MGNITTGKILNDYVGSIDDQLFLAELYNMMRTGKTGQVVPGVAITDMRHADDVKNYNLDSNDVEKILNEFERDFAGTRKEVIVEIRKYIRGLVHDNSNSR